MRWFPRWCHALILAGVAGFATSGAQQSSAAQPLPVEIATVPSALINESTPVDWAFAFKLNAATSPTTGVLTHCEFGGAPKSYRSSQSYLSASKGASRLQDGHDLIGTTLSDPVGATFAKIYRSDLNFVVWNDQFYRHPNIAGCSESCGSPWGHSKGIIAWDAAGNGVVLQVTTPSWPGSGTATAPRPDDGNTLGCIEDNDVKASQHFFALRLSGADTLAVLDGLSNASVVTDVANPQLARLGGPREIAQRAASLGHKSPSTSVTDVLLSTGVRLISKPSALHVPPWQLLSARLGGVSLRTATWWAAPRLPTTEAGRTIICWRSDLGSPGRVEVALTGAWNGKPIGLRGGPHDDANHAKIGVSIDGAHPYAIFSDLNQQGRLTGKCDSSQNGRGGMFFIVEDPELHDSISQLIAGSTAGLAIPARQKTKRRLRDQRRAVWHLPTESTDQLSSVHSKIHDDDISKWLRR